MKRALPEKSILIFKLMKSLDLIGQILRAFSVSYIKPKEEIMALRVLIVDDAAFMRMMIKDILSKNEYEVVGEAENGIAAIKLYKKLKPDLVTMDIIMPEMNGIEAVKGIISFDPQAKILMVSAMGQQFLVKEAIQAGAKDFIVKPFRPDNVLDTIEKIAGKK